MGEGGKSFQYAGCILFKDLTGVGAGPPSDEVESSPTRLQHVHHAFHLLTPHLVRCLRSLGCVCVLPFSDYVCVCMGVWVLPDGQTVLDTGVPIRG